MTITLSAADKKLLADDFSRCESDPWYFITSYAKTLDNETGEIKLFPKWEYLNKFLKDIRSEKNLSRKKSRRLLLTWFVMAYELWALEFVKNYPMFNLSRKEKLVDDGGENSTPNSLHGKIRFIWKNLPAHLKRNITFANLRIECPGTNSFIIGESSNADAGRGGGYAFGFIDEAAFIEYGETVFAAFMRACKKAVLVSTSNGPATMFCRVSKMAEKNPMWDYEFLHALVRPDRNEKYLEMCRAEMLPSQYAREIEGKDIGDVTALVWPMFDFNVHVGKGLHVVNAPLELSFDFGAGDPTAVKIIQNMRDSAVIVAEVESNNATPEQIKDMIVDKLIKLGRLKSFEEFGTSLTDYRQYVKDNLSLLPAYGDPSGNNKLQDNGDSLITQYAALGIKIVTKNASNVPLGILEVARRLNRRKFYIDESCTMSIDELSGCHYRVNERTGEIIDGQKYAHDKLSHGADAIRYWCENNPLSAEDKPQAINYDRPVEWRAPSGPIAFTSRIRGGRHGR